MSGRLEVVTQSQSRSPLEHLFAILIMPTSSRSTRCVNRFFTRPELSSERCLFHRYTVVNHLQGNTLGVTTTFYTHEQSVGTLHNE